MINVWRSEEVKVREIRTLSTCEKSGNCSRENWESIAFLYNCDKIRKKPLGKLRVCHIHTQNGVPIVSVVMTPASL